MVEWLKRLVVGDGNVIRERSYTNWNTLDVSAIVAEKTREVSCQESDESAPVATPPPAAKDKKVG